MSESEIWALSLLGLAVAGVLVAYITKQLKLIKGSSARPLGSATSGSRGEASESSLSKPSTEKLGVTESLDVIARLLIDQQVEVSEACIRIKILIDHFDPSLHELEPFSVFSLVYGKLEHMPTHQARKQTNKKFLFKLDQQRFEIEREFESAATEAARKLLELLAARQPLH